MFIKRLNNLTLFRLHITRRILPKVHSNLFASRCHGNFSVDFGKSSYKEPADAVNDEYTTDPSAVKTPYVPDNVRAEMYKLHKDDPVKWTEQALAQHYGASLYRVRAVLLLLKKREEKMNILLGTTDGSIPPNWNTLYQKYSEDMTKFTPEVLFEAFCGKDAPADGPKFASVGEIKNIIERLTEHYHRQSDLDNYNNMMESTLQELASEGN